MQQYMAEPGKNTITNKSGNNIGISGFGDADNCSAIVINPSASKNGYNQRGFLLAG